MSAVQQIGAHRLLCAKASEQSARALMPEPGMAGVVYTDPPWGPSPLHMFDTMKAKVVGENERQEWSTFLHDFAAACRWAASDHLFVMMGNPWCADTVAALTGVGFAHIESWPVDYGAPVHRPGATEKTQLKATILHFSLRGGVFLSPPARKHGLAYVRWVIDQAPGPVYDPCVGLGLMARAAVREGRQFFGSELNPARLARTAQILEKST